MGAYESESGSHGALRKLYGPPLTLHGIVYLSLFAALGLAVKQIAYPLAAIATAPFIPVSPLVAGAYMMWLSAGRAITGYRWGGTFIGLVQAFVSLLLVFGKHGAFNFPLYLSTGLAVDLVFLLYTPLGRTLLVPVIATSVSSVIGTVLVVWVELEMPVQIVAASALISMCGGAIGGFAAHQMIRLHDRVIGKERGGTNTAPT